MLCRWKEESGLSGANYQVLYKALCHKYVDRKDLAGLFCIRESQMKVRRKKKIARQNNKGMITIITFIERLSVELRRAARGKSSKLTRKKN